MGRGANGGRKERRYDVEGCRLPSVWDVDALRREMDSLGVAWSHSCALLGYLARHPEVTEWSGVDWAKGFRCDLPARFVREVQGRFACRSSQLASRHDSGDGSTSKLVVALRDGKCVEAVVMRHGTLRSRRVTVCVSSQVGCAMRCSFCATGTMGMNGDLTRGEIVEQVLFAKGLEPRLRNVVFMGMGEPLNNYDEVLGACRCLFDDKWLALGAGKVTISTVGVADRIATLAADEPRANLALSLHAPTQADRVRIMPAAHKYDLPDLVAALDAYVATKLAKHPGKHDKKAKADSKAKAPQPLVMVEYILLGGVNDTLDHAEALGALLVPDRGAPRWGGHFMVNLIAYNPTPDLPYDRPTDDAVHAFQKAVQAHGILTCVRITMGSDVAGACGQLLKETDHAKKKQPPPDVEDAVPGLPRKQPKPPPVPKRAAAAIAATAAAADRDRRRRAALAALLAAAGLAAAALALAAPRASPS